MRYLALLMTVCIVTLFSPTDLSGQCSTTIFWNGGIPSAGTTTAQGTILGTLGVTVRSVGSFQTGRPGYANNTQTYGGFTWRSLMTFRGASFATGTYTSFKLQTPMTADYIHVRVSDIRGDLFNTEHQRVRGFLNGVAVGVTFEDPVNGAFITGGNIINGASNTTSTVQSAMRAFFTGAVDSIVVTATGFSDFVIVDLFARCDIILPYQLTDFTAQRTAEGVALAWKVSREETLSAYQVERSADGRQWQTIATIASTHDQMPQKTYQYLDRTAGNEKVFYRLLSVENDGPGQYSRVIAVNETTMHAGTGIRIYPNPAGDHFTVSIDSKAQRQRPTVEILTAEGRILQRVPLTAKQTTIHCSRWPRGILLVRLIGSGGLLQTEKILLR